MINILTIGNSFSQDATYYLHQVLEFYGIENSVSNLYIGGCDLERQYYNMVNDLANYEYELNGQKTDRKVSIMESLKMKKWDVITIQQSSHDSGWIETYEPFIGKIIACIKKTCPDAKLYIHQTWAYDNFSDHYNFARYNNDQLQMYARFKKCYAYYSKKYDIPLIPSGDMVQKVRKIKPFSDNVALTRDGFHMSYVYGRYLVSITFAKKLFNVDLISKTYIPSSEFSDEVADSKIIKRINKVVDKNVK